MQKTASSEINPEVLFFFRRKFIKNMALYANSLSEKTARNILEASYPGWSISTRRRMRQIDKQKSLLFNESEEAIAHGYQDLDLSVNF